MLHALLRRKLHASIPEPERLEDALTSTLLGPLFWLEEWGVLGEWLDLNALGADAQGTETAYWFWPRLEFAEPDVVLRLGGTLLVIEAKFASGRHDTTTDDEAAISDQIVRQHISITCPRADRLAYAPLLESAIEVCSLVQVMVVDGRRMRRARREYNESLGELPAGADLRLVTWQKLYARIAACGRKTSAVADLLSYMETVGLDSFDGIGRHLMDADLQPSLLRWRAPQRRQFGIRAGVAHVDHVSVSRLRTWGRREAAGVKHAVRSQGRWAANAQHALAVLRWNAPAHAQQQKGSP